MPSPQTVRAMQQAVAHHQAGRFAQAEEIYRRVLQQEPRDVDALQLLGLLHHQSGRHAEAVELIGRAISIPPRAGFYGYLSQAYCGACKTAQSLESSPRAVEPASDISDTRY